MAKNVPFKTVPEIQTGARKSKRGSSDRARMSTPLVDNPQQLLPNGVPIGVQTVLINVLDVEPEEIEPDANLIIDLGCESIDLLAIVFQLENMYHIELPRSELFPEDILTDAEYIMHSPEARVNSAGMGALRKRMPFADFSRLEENPQVVDFVVVLTVESLRRALESKGVRFE